MTWFAHRRFASRCVLGAVALIAACATFARGQHFVMDPAHTAVAFQVSHIGLSWTHGRFNRVAGEFTINRDDLSRTSFAMTIQANSVDTGNRQRDDTLRSPDFFNVRQFPAITFKSTRVQATQEGYTVTGDLTLHGETRPVTLKLEGGRTAEFPRGVPRTGFSTDLQLKRSDFGMTGMAPAVGNEVRIAISFEGVQR